MGKYRPPVSELAFVLEHVVGYRDVAALPGFEHADMESVVDLLEQCGDFMARVVAPTNRIGDVEGAHRDPDGTVVVPAAFKAAYAKYVDAGWGAIPFPEEFGGGGFPWSVGLAIQEMLQSSNMAFALCALLTQGAIDALLHHGSDEQRQRYLPRMVSGEWTGTMNLTEPQAGSDVGALISRAVPREDGSYAISGQKIFITYGDHDMAEQIVHLVLARTPGAPAGTRGHLLLHRAQVPGQRRRLARSAKRRRMPLDRAKAGHPRLADVRALLRERHRLPDRRGELRHADHVRDDELRPARRRHAGGRRRANAPTSSRSITPACAARARRSGRPGPTRRSSTSPTCAGC